MKSSILLVIAWQTQTSVSTGTTCTTCHHFGELFGAFISFCSLTGSIDSQLIMTDTQTSLTVNALLLAGKCKTGNALSFGLRVVMRLYHFFFAVRTK